MPGWFYARTSLVELSTDIFIVVMSIMFKSTFSIE